jgi:hypothetical protein
MIRSFITAALVVSPLTGAALAASLGGYTRQDGPYVQPHLRTTPNRHPSDTLASLARTPRTSAAPCQAEMFAPQKMIRLGSPKRASPAACMTCLRTISSPAPSATSRPGTRKGSGVSCPIPTKVSDTFSR